MGAGSLGGVQPAFDRGYDPAASQYPRLARFANLRKAMAMLQKVFPAMVVMGLVCCVDGTPARAQTGAVPPPAPPAEAGDATEVRVLTAQRTVTEPVAGPRSTQVQPVGCFGCFGCFRPLCSVPHCSRSHCSIPHCSIPHCSIPHCSRPYVIGSGAVGYWVPVTPGAVRYPYSGYRRPWYNPGPAVWTSSTDMVW